MLINTLYYYGFTVIEIKNNSLVKTWQVVICWKLMKPNHQKLFAVDTLKCSLY